MVISKFLPTIGFAWIDLKGVDLSKYASSSLKGCVLEIDLEYPKQLQELCNDCPLAPDKIEIKREMLTETEYQLKIADLYNILIGNVEKFNPNFFDKEKLVLHFENLQLYLRIGLKLKIIRRVLDFNQSQWLKPYIEYNTQKGNRSVKMMTKLEKRCTN